MGKIYRLRIMASNSYEKPDFWSQKAFSEGYPARSVYKLKEIDEKLTHDYKNVVLIILDGMGEHIFNKITPNGFFMKNHIDKITSVCPSTTTAAMTTYYSGKPPIETGWIAMSQYFKEQERNVESLKD
mgnify:CR=1 FL=1